MDGSRKSSIDKSAVSLPTAQQLDRMQSRAVKKALFAEIDRSQHRLVTASSFGYQPPSFLDAQTSQNYNPYQRVCDLDPLKHIQSTPEPSEAELQGQAARNKTRRLLRKAEAQLQTIRARSLGKPVADNLSQKLSGEPHSSLVTNLHGDPIPVRIVEKRLAVCCDDGVDLKPAIYDQVNPLANKADKLSEIRLAKYQSYKYDPPVNLSETCDFIDNKVPFLVHERTAKNGDLGEKQPENTARYLRPSGDGLSLHLSEPNSIEAMIPEAERARLLHHESLDESSVQRPTTPRDLPNTPGTASASVPSPEQSKHARAQARSRGSDTAYITAAGQRRFEGLISMPARMAMRTFELNPEQVVGANTCKCACHAMTEEARQEFPQLRCPLCLCRIRDPHPPSSLTKNRKANVSPNLLQESQANVDALHYNAHVVLPETEEESNVELINGQAELVDKDLAAVQEDLEDKRQFAGSPLGKVPLGENAISPRRAKSLIDRGLNQANTHNEKLLRAALQQAILADKLWTDRLLSDISPGVSPKEIITAIKKRRYDWAPSTVVVPLVKKTNTYAQKTHNEDISYEDLLLSSALPLDLTKEDTDGRSNPDMATSRITWPRVEFSDTQSNPTGTQSLPRFTNRVSNDKARLALLRGEQRVSTHEVKSNDHHPPNISRRFNMTAQTNKIFHRAHSTTSIKQNRDERLAQKVKYSRQRAERLSCGRELMEEYTDVVEQTSSRSRARSRLKSLKAGDDITPIEDGAYYLPPSSAFCMSNEELKEFQLAAKKQRSLLQFVIALPGKPATAPYLASTMMYEVNCNGMAATLFGPNGYLEQIIENAGVPIPGAFSLKLYLTEEKVEDTEGGDEYTILHDLQGTTFYIPSTTLSKIQHSHIKKESSMTVLSTLTGSHGTCRATSRRLAGKLPNILSSRDEETTDGISVVAQSQMLELSEDSQLVPGSMAQMAPEPLVTIPAPMDEQRSSPSRLAHNMMRSAYTDPRLSQDVQDTIVPPIENGHIERALPIKSVVGAMRRARKRLEQIATDQNQGFTQGYAQTRLSIMDSELSTLGAF
ncbi:hypothetical protein GMRT_13544 [Giardia muris]|uniref:Uncharacterized protein n=1 Tax=Giardia muris TaxID=5742 RepID=A0A4Z1SW18_GIAMU|nr:hypothetical protein GMRT_13544 [Giardia muris]|eukprot:TNJ29964.1 hypothetical protein GMRT_13544 [Giardia muris]